MTIGSIVLTPRLMGWVGRPQRDPRVRFGSGEADLERSEADGARVEEGERQRQVERALSGDGEALDALFRGCRPDVLRLCTRMLGPTDAEDATNEACQRAQQRLESFDPRQPFRRWLLAIASHHCIDRLRRRSVEKRLFDPGEAEVEALADGQASALDALVQGRRRVAVRDALDRLADRDRAALVLRYFAELDYDAIGEELELTRNQVATAIFRAKQRLRDQLQHDREAAS